MASVLITGILKDAFGAPIPNYEFFFEAIRTSVTVLNTTNVKFTTSGTGSYSFTLEYGTYTLKTKAQRDLQFKTIASNILVFSQVFTNKDIQYLLTSQEGLENIDQTLLEAVLQIKADLQNALTFSVVDKGNVSLASGIYPTPEANGQGGYFSSLWYVTTGGTVSGVVFTAGDQLLYSATAAAYIKIDNTDLVSSVNGMVGTVVVTTITGNAGTATTLQTARTIGVSGDGTGTATSFNGSTNITIPFTLATVATAGTYKSVTVNAKGLVTAGTNPTTLVGYGITDAQPLDAELTALAGLSTNGILVKTAAGTAATRSVAVTGTGLSVSNADGVSGNPTVTSNATNLNTVSTLVARDASGNFSAGTITAALTGNATTATTLATARSISITGDGTWTTSFNGSANVTGTLTLATVANPGTYGSVTIDAKGRVISGTNPNAIDPSLLATKEEVVARIETTKAVTPAILNAVVPYSPNVNPTLDLDFANQVYRHFEGPDGLVSHPLTPFVTFTRSSIATFFDAMGVMKQAAVDTPRIDYDPLTGECKGLLIEEARTNLLTYSSDFNNAIWAKAGGTVLLSTNSFLAPDGTVTADLISNTINVASFLSQSQSLTTSTTYTKSLYVYPTQTNKIIISTITINGLENVMTFDLSTLSISGAQASTSSIIAVGNGWYRIIHTFTTASSGTNNNGIYYLGAYGVATTLASFYVWGAQLEAGAFPTTYIPSTYTWTARASTATYLDSTGVLQTAASGVARSAAYDYDADGVLRPIGLLLEGAATNLLLYSEQFDNAAWTKSNATITANAIAGPDGTTTADKLVEDSTTAVHLVRQTVTTSASATYTKSVYLKKAERKIAFIELYDGVTFSYAFFDLLNGAVLSATAGVTASIKLAYNGFYRCSATVTTGASATTLRSSVSPTTANSVYSYTGDGTSGIYLWRGQLEPGNYATSGIATTSSQATRAADTSTSAQATRAADNASISGANFSQWYNQNKGSVLVEFDTQLGGSIWPGVFSIQKSAASRMAVYIADSNDMVSFDEKDSGASNAHSNSTSSAVISNSRTKVAIAITKSSLSSYLSGSSMSVTVTPTKTIFGFTSMQIGNADSQLNGHIRTLKYYPKALASAELQAMTA